MKQTLTKRAIRNMWDGLQAIAGQDLPTKFTHAAARNRAKVRPIIESLKEAGEPVAGFDERRIDLAQEMAVKDPQGQPVMLPNNQGYAVSDMFNFNRRLDIIKTELGQDKKDKEVEEILNEEEDVDIYMVSEQHLPATMRTDVLEGLLPMIAEDEGAPVRSISDKG
jgi:hypothetical protein